jgi:hypothetical protein
VLPLGASTVEDLEGCVVEVRDAGDGTVLLRGTIEDLPGAVDGEPGDDGDESEALGRALLVPGPLALGEARVEAKRCEDDDEGEVEESLEVEVEGEAPGLALEVWVADASSVLVLAGAFDVDEEGCGEVEFETEDGGALPAGASSVLDLVGRALEVRVAAGGAVLYSGTVPALAGD